MLAKNVSMNSTSEPPMGHENDSKSSESSFISDSSGDSDNDDNKK